MSAPTHRAGATRTGRGRLLLVDGLTPKLVRAGLVATKVARPHVLVVGTAAIGLVRLAEKAARSRTLRTLTLVVHRVPSALLPHDARRSDALPALVDAVDALLRSIEQNPPPAALQAFTTALTRQGRKLIGDDGRPDTALSVADIACVRGDDPAARRAILNDAWRSLPGWPASAESSDRYAREPHLAEACGSLGNRT